ncbi:MAG TPA: sigma-70 family RNA polymerase sigma factor [Acidimicrobiales bacterium]|nr:sigma-70 family RNA polymerase sigma factor [Acidimicrobiales bacterium]
MPEAETPAERTRATRARLGTSFPDVLAAARADAPWAYERLWGAYAAAVASYLRAQGAEDPDSLANDVFWRAFTNLATFEGDEPSFRSWLFTIAHHRLIDDRRRRSRRPQRADDEVADAHLGAEPAADDHALARIGGAEVGRLLARLSDDQREVLLLRIVGDLTIEQIADALGKRPGAIKALQRRGLAALRRLLEEDRA